MDIMSLVKKNRSLINIIVAGVCVLFSCIALYSILGQSFGIFSIFKLSFIAGLVPLLAPAGALVFRFVLSKGMGEKQNSMIMAIIFAAGLVLLFIAKGMISSAAYGFSIGLGFGGVLSLLGYLVGIAANVIGFLFAD